MPRADRVDKVQRRTNMRQHGITRPDAITRHDGTYKLAVLIDRDPVAAQFGNRDMADTVHAGARQQQRAPGVAVTGQHQDCVVHGLVGRQVAVNPLLIFLALIFGVWLWGPIGGFVALPLVIWCLVLFDPQTLELGEMAATPSAGPGS